MNEGQKTRNDRRGAIDDGGVCDKERRQMMSMPMRAIGRGCVDDIMTRTRIGRVENGTTRARIEVARAENDRTRGEDAQDDAA